MTHENACRTMDSPIGPLMITARNQAITGVYTKNHPRLQDCQKNTNIFPVLTNAMVQLQDYFAGRRRHFDLVLDPGGTPFQRQVWSALQSIPYGQTQSYGSIAALLGMPKSARAVGMANGQNPISIIIPCHRVIGANGSMTGYAGGIETKEWLLAHEKSEWTRE